MLIYACPTAGKTRVLERFRQSTAKDIWLEVVDSDELLSAIKYSTFNLRLWKHGYDNRLRESIEEASFIAGQTVGAILKSRIDSIILTNLHSHMFVQTVSKIAGRKYSETFDYFFYRDNADLVADILRQGNKKKVSTTILQSWVLGWRRSSTKVSKNVFILGEGEYLSTSLQTIDPQLAEKLNLN